jgi:hypothetical protein
MSLRQLSTRIELSFWQMVITLLSESDLLQRLIRWFYLDLLPRSVKFLKQFELRQVFRWAAAGLGMGFIIGFLIAIF